MILYKNRDISINTQKFKKYYLIILKNFLLVNLLIYFYKNLTINFFNYLVFVFFKKTSIKNYDFYKCLYFYNLYSHLPNKLINRYFTSNNLNWIFKKNKKYCKTKTIENNKSKPNLFILNPKITVKVKTSININFFLNNMYTIEINYDKTICIDFFNFIKPKPIVLQLLFLSLFSNSKLNNYNYLYFNLNLNIKNKSKYKFYFFKNLKIFAFNIFYVLKPKNTFYSFKNLKKSNFLLKFNNFLYLTDLKFLSEFKYNKFNFLFLPKHYNSLNLFKCFAFENDFNIYGSKFFITNGFILNNLNLLSNYIFYKNINPKVYHFNNYYPIYNSFNSYDLFVYNFKHNYNLNFLLFLNNCLINFFENIFKKYFFIRINNNLEGILNKTNKYYLNGLLNDYKFYKQQNFKNLNIGNFIYIIWYSFFLKDLTMLSKFISKYMESLNFRFHRKFLLFFQNIIIKYSELFLNVLKVKGFFFDIRGKVGVTGNSKKRHFCFNFGSLNRSSKSFKINFNQSLIRTYSGVMGVTYMLSY